MNQRFLTLFHLSFTMVIPNLVCVIQGFLSSQSWQKNEGWEASVCYSNNDFESIF